MISQAREWGVYLIILFLPAYQIRFQLAGIPLTLLEVLILLLALVELVYLLQQRQFKTCWRTHVTNHPLRSAFILLFLISATLSVFVSPLPVKAAGLWKAFFIEPVLFFFLILNIFDAKQKLNRLLYAFATLVLALSAFGIFQFITLYNLPFHWWAVDVASRRIVSLVNHPNALAHLLGPPLALLMMLVLTKDWAKQSKLFLAAVSLGAVSLFLTFSRAGWLAFLLTLTVFGLFTQHKKKIIASGLIVVLLIAAIPFTRNITARLLTGRDLSQENRLVLWTAAADILNQSPLLGIGLRGFHEAYKNYPLGPDQVVQNYPHNWFLNFWIETGILGLFSILSLLVLFYKRVWKKFKKNKGLALALAAGMSVVLLHGQVDVPYFKNDLSVLFWSIYALPFIPEINQPPQQQNRR